MEYGFVYIWRDRKHSRYYIGCHWGYEDDGYVCSSFWMNQAYKRRPQDFKRRILIRIYTNKQDLLNEEYRWLQMIKPEEIKIKYYNLRNHKFNSYWTDENKTKTVKQKISIAHKESGRFSGANNYFYGKGYLSSGANNYFYGKSPNWGKPCLEKTRKLISEANLGNTNAKGKKHKSPSPLKGRKLNISDEERKIKSERMKEIKPGKGNKGKISPFKGIPRSEETKRKISETKKSKRQYK